MVSLHVSAWVLIEKEGCLSDILLGEYTVNLFSQLCPTTLPTQWKKNVSKTDFNTLIQLNSQINIVNYNT